MQPSSKSNVQGILEKAREVCVPIKSGKSSKPKDSGAGGKAKESSSAKSVPNSGQVKEQKEPKKAEPAKKQEEKQRPGTAKSKQPVICLFSSSLSLRNR